MRTLCSNSTIRNYVGGIKSKHTLFISDACFSGGIFKERGITESGRAMVEMYELKSRKAMTSGTLKTIPDKSVLSNIYYSVYERIPQPIIC